MVGCSVWGCKSRSERKISGITFHSFPTNKEIQTNWLVATGRKNWQPGKYAKICSLHFDADCFVYRKNKVELKPNSIPKNQTQAMGDHKKLHKCNMCIRTYSFKEALERHRQNMHGKKSKLKPTRNIRPPARTGQKVNKSEQTNSLDNSVSSRNFLCPICAKTFPSEFVAQKHIDVYHSKVKFSKKHTPIQLVECRKCKQKIKNLQPHMCQEVKPNKINTYVCAACNQKFFNIKLFDHHTVRDHNDMVESLFFPSLREFATWKESMEKVTNVTYAEIEENDEKKYYHCSIRNVENTKTDRCPSMISVELFPKGVLANFYVQHYKHSCTEYKLTSAYKKYCIKNLLKPSESLSNADSDPYLHLKTLMDNIVIEAAKINIDALKQLMGKAFEMTLILNNYDEEREETRPNKYLTDAEITHVLQSNSTTIKRVRMEPAISLEPQIKKPRESIDEEMAPKIVNTFSLAGDMYLNSDTDSGDEKDIDNEILKSNNTTIKKIKEAPIDVRKDDDVKEKEFISFNDTYKDFVSKNFSEPKVPFSKQRTYEYQVKSNKKINVSIKDINHSSTAVDNSEGTGTNAPPNSCNATNKKPPMIKVRNDIIKTPSKEQIPQKVKNETKLSSSKARAQLKSKIDTNATKEPLQENVKSNIIKTSKPKLAGMNEKLESLGKSNINTSLPNVMSESPRLLSTPKKIDYQYEVIEQETGCNILVLKV